MTIKTTVVCVSACTHAHTISMVVGGQWICLLFNVIPLYKYVALVNKKRLDYSYVKNIY